MIFISSSSTPSFAGGSANGTEVGGWCNQITKFSSSATIVATIGPFFRTFAQHSIEFIDKQIERLQRAIARDAGDEIRAANLDPTSRDELRTAVIRVLLIEVDAHSNDPAVMAKKARQFRDGGFAKVCTESAKQDLFRKLWSRQAGR